jgi:hypothetical protein
MRVSAESLASYSFLKDVYKKISTALQHIFFHIFLTVIGILKIKYRQRLAIIFWAQI